MEQGTVINEVLDTFCVSSSKKMNKKKTQIFFSKNVISAKACRIGKGLGFTVTKSLGNYRQLTSLVNCGSVCLPKAYGELGVKTLKSTNSALFMRIGWGLVSNSNNFLG